MAAVPKRLYDFPFSGNGYKVRLALAQLGIGVDYRVVDLIARETRADWFLALNPMGEIPVLELSDGTLLRESNAILFWLCGSYTAFCVRNRGHAFWHGAPSTSLTGEA